MTTRVTLICLTCKKEACRDLLFESGSRGVHETLAEVAMCPDGHGSMVCKDGHELNRGELRANNGHFTIHVINTHHLKGNQLVGEYIGRGSLLGNPYSHMRGTTAKFLVGTREEAVNLYEKALEAAIRRGAPVTIGELKRLADIAKTQPLELRCYCSPKNCHGDVIKRFIENYLERGDWLHAA